MLFYKDQCQNVQHSSTTDVDHRISYRNYFPISLESTAIENNMVIHITLGRSVDLSVDLSERREGAPSVRRTYCPKMSKVSCIQRMNFELVSLHRVKIRV